MNKSNRNNLSNGNLEEQSNDVKIDDTENMKKWYENKIEEIAREREKLIRIETKSNFENKSERKVETKLEKNTTIQTNIKSKKRKSIETKKDGKSVDSSKIEKSNTTAKKDSSSKKLNIIKEIKTLNKVKDKTIKLGKNINTAISNENGMYESFEENINTITRMPIKKATKFIQKKLVKLSIKAIDKLIKLVTKVIKKIIELIASTIEYTYPIIIVLIIIFILLCFWDTNISEEYPEEYMSYIQNEYDDNKLAYYYNYTDVKIDDEQLNKIYNEFLKNAGKRYLMDHSNLKYDECMDYYDCSSWVIHCLAHTGIKKIPNSGAGGIYRNYCNPIEVNDRKGGDLIFLKDTYDTGEPGSISHIGIYMGELTINGETAEWVIDTGGNPSGVRIRKYKNGWWNGSNFFRIW
ncbi:MAG TPA: NlpC/P60 family protein [Clostridiaceae bacterium]|mgnify:CR=1 FL=1|nr:NlpC/P60 family protein [Clostridiaceae bacterium]